MIIIIKAHLNLCFITLTNVETELPRYSTHLHYYANKIKLCTVFSVILLALTKHTKIKRNSLS